MERKQQTKEAAMFEFLTVLAALVLFLWFFSSGFRAGIQVFLSGVLIMALVIFTIWLLGRFMQRKQPSARFRTFIDNACQTGEPAHKQRPAAFVQRAKYVHSMPEPML
jgi:hypothetical protein